MRPFFASLTIPIQANGSVDRGGSRLCAGAQIRSNQVDLVVRQLVDQLVELAAVRGHETSVDERIRPWLAYQTEIDRFRSWVADRNARE